MIQVPRRFRRRFVTIAGVRIDRTDNPKEWTAAGGVTIFQAPSGRWVVLIPRSGKTKFNVRTLAAACALIASLRRTKQECAS